MAVGAERHVFILTLEMRFAVRSYSEVRAVSSMMPFRILQSMLLSFGIEVATRRLEVGPFAFCILMKMDGMFSRRQTLEIDFQANAVRPGFPKNRRADDLALAIFDLNQHLRRTDRCECCQQQCEGEKPRRFHRPIIAMSGASVATI